MSNGTTDAIEELREKFIRNSAGRLEDLAALIQLLASTPSDGGALDELMRKLHGLAGLGATFGFVGVTTIARHAEVECQQVLSERRTASPELLEMLRESLEALRGEFERGGALLPQFSVYGPSRHTDVDMVLLEDDPIAHEMLGRILAKQGYLVRSAHTRSHAIRLIDEKLPDALVSDVLLPDGSGYDVVEHLRAQPGGDVPPAIITSAVQGFLDRVEAVHRGADAFFEKPIDFAALVQTLENLLERTRERTPRLLHITDENSDTEFIESVLESAGYSVRISRDARRFDAELTNFRPDLVLLNAAIDEASPFDLTRWARQKQGLATMPVLIVGGSGTAEMRMSCVRAGADDWLPLPLHPGLLLATVAARLERARYVRNLLEHDGLTGLLTHSAFIGQLHRAWYEHERGGGRHPSFVLIDVDQFKRVNDTYGHPVGDRVLTWLAVVLRKNLRRSDTIARYGGEEFAVLLDDLATSDAVRLMDRIRLEFSEVEHHDDAGRPFKVTFSAGISGIPAAATEPEAWIAAADQALYAAKSEGRNRIVFSA